MNLIGFIFDNFFLVIIALWVLFSIFSKAGRQPGNQRNRESQQMPGTGQQQQPQRREEYRKPFPDAPKPQAEKMGTPKLQQMREQIDELEQRSNTDSIIQETIGTIYESDIAKQDIQRNNPFDTQQLSKASVQGMMWKEVFGPPRAKEPFRRTGRRTYR